ncbi:UNVERIFIED_ORG: hypothetical protein ABIB21_003237 [Arthrobacter sp. UYEF13]
MSRFYRKQGKINSPSRNKSTGITRKSLPSILLCQEPWVLALYGADRPLPLDTEPRQLAFIPVAAGLLLAAVIAIWRAPKGKSSRSWIFGAIGIIMILLALLVAAGLLAPSS